MIASSTSTITKKPVVRIKNPKRFLVNKENQELQQEIFDTFVEWTTWQLIDEVFLSLISVKSQFCMINARDDSKNRGAGVIRRSYEEQGRYKIYRMVVYRPPPTFVIHLKDLDEKVKGELAKRDKELRDFVLRQAVERIIEQVDSRYFLLSAKQYLKVGLEK
jgi:hypothetical protein